MSAKWPDALWQAYVVSGFDQEIPDPEDENPDRRWEQKQLPRQDAILAACPSAGPLISRPTPC